MLFGKVLLFLILASKAMGSEDHRVFIREQGSIINLDSSLHDLEKDEARLGKWSSNTSSSQASSNQASNNHLTGNLMRFEISERDRFDFEKLEYVVSKNPKSVVFFKDTNTILVPEQDIINGIKDEDRLTYVEIDIKEIREPLYESILFAASPCLKFPAGGDGSLTVGYNIGLSLTPSISTELDYTVNMIAFDLSSSFGISNSVSFGGTYQCSAVNGTDVRLFYKIATIQGRSNKRYFFYDRYRKVLYKGDWMNSKLLKFMIDSSPMYYCGTSDKLDLMCENTGIEYVDSNGNIIRNQLIEESP